MASWKFKGVESKKTQLSVMGLLMDMFNEHYLHKHTIITRGNTPIKIEPVSAQALTKGSHATCHLLDDGCNSYLRYCCNASLDSLFAGTAELFPPAWHAASLKDSPQAC